VQFRTLTLRRIATLALAIRLYRVDHNEQWPASLAALTPAYLPKIPTDPFSPTSSEIRYRTDSPGGPILYSVGINGTDENGSELPAHPVPGGFTSNQWDCLDVVFHLTAPPTTTQPDRLP
jgi:hypothetical protein